MAKVLLINGSPNREGCTYTALKEISDTLNKEGIETEIYHIGTKPIAGCIACRKCYELKRCVFDDGVNEVARRMAEFDGIIIGSPVYFAGPNGSLCAFLDRLFYSCGNLRGKLGASVASCRRAGSTVTFDRLNKYFTIKNMHIVGSQYWNEVHGNTPDEVRQDLEGMQTMRTLALNMAWLLKSIEAGKEKGLEMPELEKKISTNFIR